LGTPILFSLHEARRDLRTASHPFIVFDDPGYVYENAMVQAGLSWEGVGWAFTTGTRSNWHPLTWLSHMADVECFGDSAGGHHFTNAEAAYASALRINPDYAHARYYLALSH